MLRKFSWLFTVLIVSFLVSCSGGSSSNGDGRGGNSSSSDRVNTSSEVNSNSNCSDEFGDASRCETRDSL